MGGKRNEAIRPMISAGNESRPAGGGVTFLGRPNFLPLLGLGALRCRLAGGLTSMDLESESGGVPGLWRGPGVDPSAVPVPMMMGGYYDDEGRGV